MSGNRFKIALRPVGSRAVEAEERSGVSLVGNGDVATQGAIETWMELKFEGVEALAQTCAVCPLGWLRSYLHRLHLSSLQATIP